MNAAIKQLVDAAVQPRIKGKNVILIDDVLTTGKTLEIATNHLKSAGVLSVQVAVLAVTEMPQKGKKK